MAGAAETIAYLPRCDLGIVLVDAASTLTKEDLQVIHVIYTAGASAMVLLSKADLLHATDRERTLDYVRKQIRAEVNVEPSVHPVSVVGPEASLCDQWCESQLRPMLDAHRELAAASLKRKIGGLREALLVTLKKRAEGTTAPSEEINPSRLQETEQALRGSAQMLEVARGEADDLARNVRELEDRLIETAADEIAALWLRRDSTAVDPAETFSTTATRLVAEQSAKSRPHTERVRAQLAEILQSAVEIIPSAKSAFQELPTPTGLPLPDPSAVAQKLTLRRPAILALFGRVALRHHLRTKLGEQVGPEHYDFLGLYRQRLSLWAKETFAAVETAFSASAEILCAQLAQRSPAPPAESADARECLRRDISLLESWEHRPATAEPVSTR